VKKLIVITVLFLVAVGVGGYAYFQGKRYTIVLTNEQINYELDKRFPITKSHLLILSVTYQDPGVVLHEGSDEVTVGLAVVLNSTIK